LHACPQRCRVESEKGRVRATAKRRRVASKVVRPHARAQKHACAPPCAAPRSAKGTLAATRARAPPARGEPRTAR
jgi:hypothetical protein